MLFKNLIRIINNYKFYLIKIIFFELMYYFKGYKGNRFNFSKNDFMTDNLPCPYYFLLKINNALKNKDIKNFLDLGCGSGRIIDFLSKNFPDKNFTGIEYFSEQYEYCKNIFKSKKNVNIINADFTKSDFFQYDADCYFLNEPFKKNLEFIEFMEKTVNSSLGKKNILFIFINCNRQIIENLKNIKCLEEYYINDKKGYSIYSIN